MTDPPRTTRLKLWELETRLICPVIGTCLTVGELRRIGVRLKVPGAADMTDYALHVGFVSTCQHGGTVARAVHRALDRKFATPLKRFAGLRDAAELEAAWQAAIARGEVPGALWALVGHPRATARLRTLAYETVHMLSHQVGAGLRADLKRLAEAERELADERRRKQEAERAHTRTLREREARIQALERDAVAQRDALRRAQRDLASRPDPGDGEALAREHAALSRRLAHATRRADLAETRLAELDTRFQALLGEHERLVAERAAAPAPAAVAGRAADADPDEDSGLPGVDLAGRTLLCVGGRTHLEPHYQAIVNRCRGQWLHHDGGVEDNIHRLDALLASADAVICPLDCVSHDAYWRAKRFCKRTGKPCVLVAQSGITSFARALGELGEPGETGLRMAGSAPGG